MECEAYVSRVSMNTARCTVDKDDLPGIAAFVATPSKLNGEWKVDTQKVDRGETTAEEVNCLWSRFWALIQGDCNHQAA